MPNFFKNKTRATGKRPYTTSFLTSILSSSYVSMTSLQASLSNQGKSTDSLHQEITATASPKLRRLRNHHSPDPKTKPKSEHPPGDRSETITRQIRSRSPCDDITAHCCLLWKPSRQTYIDAPAKTPPKRRNLTPQPQRPSRLKPPSKLPTKKHQALPARTARRRPKPSQRKLKQKKEKTLK